MRVTLRRLRGVKPQTTWQEVDQYLALFQRALSGAGSPVLPTDKDQASPKDDAALDVWCAGVCVDPLMAMDTPEDLRPWFAARLLCARHQGCDLARLAGGHLPASLPNGAHYLLVNTWHTHGKKLWPHLRARGGK